MNDDKKWSNWLEEINHNVSITKIVDYPFQHFVIDPFLPQNLYEEIIAFWPDRECFWGQREISDHNIEHIEANLRRVVIMEDASGFSKTNSAKYFWKNFKTIMCGDGFKNMLIQQFGENISKTRPELTLSTTNCWIKSILGIDQSGFYLAPHVDSVDSLINLLFFVPYPKSNPDIGTVLYQPTPEITSQILTAKNKFPSKYYKEEHFTEVYRAPYKSNLLFGMINSPLGFHGVKKLENMKSDRRHIQWILSLNEKKNLSLRFGQNFSRRKTGRFTAK